MNPLEVIRPLGFTAYKGKAYLALLQASPMTVYAVAQHSDILHIKIYKA